MTLMWLFNGQTLLNQTRAQNHCFLSLKKILQRLVACSWFYVLAVSATKVLLSATAGVNSVEIMWSWGLNWWVIAFAVSTKTSSSYKVSGKSEEFWYENKRYYHFQFCWSVFESTSLYKSKLDNLFHFSAV